VALSGLVRLEGTAFPAEYRGNLFSAQHNTRSVGRHVLAPQGSTFRSDDSAFVTTDDPDFHPSDVVLDADGSLLVIDTGAWYVQHCPTGRIRPSQSRGGLFRVRWAQAPRIQDPWGRQLDWPALKPRQLAALLCDPRPAVRDRAGFAMAVWGREAIDALSGVLRNGADSTAKTAAVWALAAIGLEYLESSLRSGRRPSADDLRKILDDVPSLPKDRKDALLRIHEANLASRRARLAEYKDLLTGGDPVRGQAVFSGPKAACATCHRIGDAGGRVGPDLTKIGAIRSGHDLLESIVFPSSTFAQGYEPYTVATAGGRVFTGLIARQDADVVVLRDSSGAETRLGRGEIEEMRRIEASIMPEGLANVLTRRELMDLLAFLKAQR
jgi:putative heme-binding domain-containing protein